MTGSRNRVFIQVPDPVQLRHHQNHAGDACMADEKKPLRDASFKSGDAVELRESTLSKGEWARLTRGLVVRVKNEDGGEFVTVQWLVRFGMEGKTSVHRARDLRKLSA